MSFNVADLTAKIVIEDGLRNLRENPHHLEFILSRYACDPLGSLVGRDFVKNGMNLIMNQKLRVSPYYVLDKDEYPNIMIASSYTEDTTYFNDHGFITELSEIQVDPVVYAEFDIKGIQKFEGEIKSALLVDPNYNLEDKLWIGVTVTNEKESAKVVGVYRYGNTTVVMLDSSIPKGAKMKDWKALVPRSNKMASINTSTDKVTIQAKLTTTGDPDVHRVFSLVVKYCLKRGRKLFDRYGIQNVFIAQTPPIPASESYSTGDILIESVFTVEGVCHDSWIEREGVRIERNELDSVLVSENKKNERVKF